MTQTIESLHKLDARDIPAAVSTLTDAFRDDPIWKKVFNGTDNFPERFASFFEVPARFALRYGSLYATSPSMEGVAGWVPGRFADMTFGRIFASGAMGCALRIGLKAALRMKPLDDVLPPDRKRHMSGKNYLYVQVVGVASERQGSGYGSRLIRTLADACDREGLWLYLETETERNVDFYERHGFSVLKEIQLPKLDLPMWEMSRRPLS